MQARALDYLERDMLRNIVALKMLTAHDDVRCFHHSNQVGEAVMVLLEPQVFAYDCEHYPDADCIAIISSDHPSLTREPLAHLEKVRLVVFKLNSEAVAELQQRGKRSRYQVQENNLASIRVAQNADLELFLTITHWF